MPNALVIALTDQQRAELERARARDPRPYMRERAAALLQIAAGASGLSVARHGLLRARRPDTVYGWVKRYQAEGLAGLWIKAGRGRKPAFSPSVSGRRQRPERVAARGAARAAAVR
jgi:hypothetical protein